MTDRNWCWFGWHDWTKWGEQFPAKMDGCRTMVQYRSCNRCGKTQVREI